MKSVRILAAGLVAAAASVPSDGAEPSMEFTAAPAVAARGRPANDVRQYRRADTMTVVLRIPTACGLVPANPSFKLTEDVLQLHYSVPALEAEEGATSCFSTAVFTLKGLPRRPLRAVPHGHRKPALIAAYGTEPGVAGTAYHPPGQVAT